MVGLRWPVLLGFCGGVVCLVSGLGLMLMVGTVVGFGVLTVCGFCLLCTSCAVAFLVVWIWWGC